MFCHVHISRGIDQSIYKDLPQASMMKELMYCKTLAVRNQLKINLYSKKTWLINARKLISLSSIFEEIFRMPKTGSTTKSGIYMASMSTHGRVALMYGTKRGTSQMQLKPVIGKVIFTV